MKKSITTLFKNETLLWASALSLLISFVMSFTFYINNDGFYYLNGAQDILNLGFAATHPSLSWPFYPLLIAVTSYCTALSPEHSALLLQAGFQVLLIISFVSIVRVLGGNKTVQALAALTLLLHPDLIAYRDSILRDFGYWGFLFASFYMLIRYYQKPSWNLAFAWFSTIAIATLFRIEGVVIIALSPLIGLLDFQSSWKSRLTAVIQLYTPWILLGFAGIVFVFIYSGNTLPLGRLHELSIWWNDFFTGSLVSKWNHFEVLLAGILPLLHEDSAKAFIWGGFIAYLAYELVKTIYPFFLALVFYGQWQHSLEKAIPRFEQRIIYALLAITFLVPTIFIISRWFMRGRFLMPFTLLLLIWVPFTLYAIYERYHKHAIIHRYSRLIKTTLIALVFGLLIDGMISFNSPASVVKESAQWIDQNTSEQATLYSNNFPLLYYAHRPGSDFNAIPIAPPLETVLSDKNWKKYDYLALFIKRKDKKTEQLISQYIPYPPIQRFENSRGYQVWIFKGEHEK